MMDAAASRTAPPLRLSRRRRAASRRRGLTLVEVLATVVLMAIVLPVAMNGISLCLTAASVARHRTEAAGLAEAKLNEMIATGEWQFGMTSGDFGPAWPDYRWAGGVADWDDPTLSELTVRVFWTARGQQREVALTTLVYQSQSSGF